MTRRNQDHVAIESDQSYYWAFVMASTAGTSEDHLRELTALTRTVIDCSKEFLTPIEVSYFVKEYSENSQFPFDGDQVKPAESHTRQIEDNNGVTADAIGTSIEKFHGRPVRIPRIAFDRNQVRVHLSDGDQVVDRSGKCTPYTAGDPQDRDPLRDPLTVTLGHAPNLDYPEIDAEYVQYVKVKPESWIWLEPTEIGQVNREYLARFLSCIDTAGSFEMISREPEQGLRYELKDIY